jgi:hypothetical protein
MVWAVWESQSPRPKGRSMPGLVLAIWQRKVSQCENDVQIWFWLWREIN